MLVACCPMEKISLINSVAGERSCPRQIPKMLIAVLAFILKALFQLFTYLDLAGAEMTASIAADSKATVAKAVRFDPTSLVLYIFYI